MYGGACIALVTVVFVLVLLPVFGTWICCDSSDTAPEVDADLEDGYRFPADAPDVLQITCRCVQPVTTTPTPTPVRSKVCVKRRRQRNNQ